MRILCNRNCAFTGLTPRLVALNVEDMSLGANGDGTLGNPILLDESAHAQILSSATNLACRHLIERQPELVSAYETNNTRFISDLNTLEDVQALVRRTGWQLELPAAQETVE